MILNDNNDVDKEDISPSCRLCGERDETVSHIVSECKELAQNDYKKQGMTKLLLSCTGRCARNMDFPPLQGATNIS